MTSFVTVEKQSNFEIGLNRSCYELVSLEGGVEIRERVKVNPGGGPSR